MVTIEDLEKRVALIEQRNKKVELDKAWEQSFTRKLIIAVLTYFVIVLYLTMISIDHPFLNAIVPAAGFYLSTLALNVVKNWWIGRRRS